MVIGFNKQFPDKIIAGTKLHTIREDSKDRWKVGVWMHMATGVRTKKYNCFKGDICTGTQEIEIIWHRNIFFLSKVAVWVDCNVIGYYYPEKTELTDKKVIELALNDGFDSVDDFFKWFNKDYEGKIIHWTNLRY